MYHWVRGCVNEPLSIYTFKPHGSKNITDLNFLESCDSNAIAPEVVCHDQEPLNYDIHKSIDAYQCWKHVKQFRHLGPDDQIRTDAQINLLTPYFKNLGFFAALRAIKPRSIFDRYILLHSEKNSSDVEKFKGSAEPVYYWCHGIIARDWYRFAESDPRLNRQKNSKDTFLIYCRAWSGTREYRLKFLQILIDQQLINHCKTSVLQHDQGYDLLTYKCNNSNFQPDNAQLCAVPINLESAVASADYCAEDFANTDISIVLETIADDTKIHLTEKTLRPIACGHPFMLIAGPGSLEYLRSYGFKTFAPWINESYDQEPNIVKRMKMVTAEMERIQSMPVSDRKYLLFQLQTITQFNKRHFFSDDFFNQIRDELVENFGNAINNVKSTRGKYYLIRKIISKKLGLKNSNDSDSTKLKKLMIAKVLRQLRNDPTISLQEILNQYPENFFNV